MWTALIFEAMRRYLAGWILVSNDATTDLFFPNTPRVYRFHSIHWLCLSHAHFSQYEQEKILYSCLFSEMIFTELAIFMGLTVSPFPSPFFFFGGGWDQGDSNEGWTSRTLLKVFFLGGGAVLLSLSANHSLDLSISLRLSQNHYFLFSPFLWKIIPDYHLVCISFAFCEFKNFSIVSQLKFSCHAGSNVNLFIINLSLKYKCNAKSFFPHRTSCCRNKYTLVCAPLFCKVM